MSRKLGKQKLNCLHPYTFLPLLVNRRTMGRDLYQLEKRINGDTQKFLFINNKKKISRKTLS